MTQTQTQFACLVERLRATTAGLLVDGTLALNHLSAGRDAAGVEHTQCGLVIPRLAQPCTGYDWCPDCKDQT